MERLFWAFLLRTVLILSAFHSPENHILLFKRALGTDPQTGRVNPNLQKAALDEYKHQPGLRRNAVA